MKILIIRLSSIGDCVLASPVLEALRERYPDAHLAWAVQAKSVAAVRGLPGLSEELLWDEKPSKGRSLWRALMHARRTRFDVALDLQGLDKAAIFSLASGAKRRISGDSARSLPRRIATEIVQGEAKLHARDFFLGRAAPLDIAPDAAQRFFPRLPLKPEHWEFARRFLQEHNCNSERVIGLNLGASIPANRWPIERFAELTRALLQDDSRARVIAFGSPADWPLWEQFESQARDDAHFSRVICAVGKTGLMQLAALTARCQAFVTADTGPMHIAAAMGAPVLALFGPARVWRTAPVQNPDGAPLQVLDAAKITGSWPAPMESHTVEAVLDATRAMMQSAQNAGFGPEHFEAATASNGVLTRR